MMSSRYSTASFFSKSYSDRNLLFLENVNANYKIGSQSCGVYTTANPNLILVGRSSKLDVVLTTIIARVSDGWNDGTIVVRVIAKTGCPNLIERESAIIARASDSTSGFDHYPVDGGSQELTDAVLSQFVLGSWHGISSSALST